MLIVISDLHFLDETAGRHNPSAAAFEHVFFPHIVRLAQTKKARSVRLLLLGDVFELLRSEQWLESEPDDRPWGKNALLDLDAPRAGSGTEEWALKILGRLPASGEKPTDPEPTILSKNWAALRFIREFGPRLQEALGSALPVEVVYVPGNHDRLCNVYPALRDEVASILGLTIRPATVQGNPDGEWWFLNEYLDEEHGVFARHGHQFDMWNYGGGHDLTRHGHIQVPIGDVLGVEFATKLPYRLSLYQSEHPAITQELVDFVRELGLVRPFTHAMEWLYYMIKSLDRGEVRKVLDVVFDEIVKEILDLEFVQQWRTPDSRMDDALRFASSKWLRWISRGLLDRLAAEDLLPYFAGVGHNPRDPEQDKHMKAAYHEASWKENEAIHFVLYGHTHFPQQRALDAHEGHEVVYINTGSWRDSIFKTTVHDTDPDFMRFGQITYSIFYREDEDTEDKLVRAVNYETWSGMQKTIRRGMRGASLE